MSQPNSVDELNAKYNANYKLEGFGIGNVMIHHPCPFCAEPDFLVCELMQVPVEIAKERVCAKCQRGQKALLKPSPSGSMNWELVQTQGPNPPDWFPKMRRVSA